MRLVYLLFMMVLIPVQRGVAQDNFAGRGIQIIHDIEYKKCTLPTGERTALRFDIYRPAGVAHKKRPAIVFVHGGGFAEGDKASALYVRMATAFARRGWVCFSVNYTLKPAATLYDQSVLDTCVSDVMAAVRWMTANSALYDLDGSEIFICGDSAGGGIAVNTCYDPRYSKYFIGCIDLWGGLPGQHGWDAPIFAGNNTGSLPPTCIIHGTKDRIVPFGTSEQLAGQLTGVGVYHEIHPLAGADHYPVDLADSFIPIMIAFSDRVIAGFSKSRGVVQYVNPFIGTANSGNTNPGAVRPWGMVSLSPFNSYDPVTRSSGASPYYYGNKTISGFTHLNMSGVGCGDMGTFCLMPTTGEFNCRSPYACSEYSNEQASPGYYAVLLNNYHIKAEVTTSIRSSIACFQFPKGRSNILLNLGIGLTTKKGAMIRRVSDVEIEGFKNIGNICGLKSMQTVYFVARVSRQPMRCGIWSEGIEYSGFQREIAGDEVGAYFSFDTREGEKVYIKTGVSYVSIENARKNLEAEQSGFDFERIRKLSELAWNHELSKIRVEGGTADQRIEFYTAMYHALLHPNIFNDANGEYRVFEGGGRSRVRGVERYTVFSLWDTYRCLHPFLSLVFPGKESAMVKSLLGMAREGGWLPRWEYAGIESGAMSGDPALSVIADTWLRGIHDFDIGQAYGAMKHNAGMSGKGNISGTGNTMRPGMSDWLKYGYIPEDAPYILHPFAAAESRGDYANMRERGMVWGSVSTSLEYGMADRSLAELAKALGKKDDCLAFLRRSQLYRNSFDTVSGFMRSRLFNGDWVEPFDPANQRNDGFTEGSAWNYRFMIPYDIPGLIKLMGGERKFIEQLDACFAKGYFDITNEPDLAYPYLFNHVKGEEWRTQEKVREIMAGSFKNAPGGLPGNDDCGTMSAWLLFGMMGFYPDCPGNMNYQLSGPVFTKITIALDQQYYPGKTFIITATAAGEYKGLIRSIVLNGKAYNQFTILHKEISKGAVLQFAFRN